MVDIVYSAVVNVSSDAPTEGGTLRDIPEFLALKKCSQGKNRDNRCVDLARMGNRLGLYHKYLKILGLDKIH